MKDAIKEYLVDNLYRLVIESTQIHQDQEAYLAWLLPIWNYLVYMNYVDVIYLPNPTQYMDSNDI